MDASTLLNSLIFALSGVVVGWLLQLLTSEIKERREIHRSVSMAAAAIFGRLKKMLMAKQKGDNQIFNDEKYHLGQDSDRFLQALSRRNKIKQGEMKIYEELSALLIGIEPEEYIVDQITKLIEDVKQLIIYAA
jgi:hypothetical protein